MVRDVDYEDVVDDVTAALEKINDACVERTNERGDDADDVADDITTAALEK